jgi:hypothetical protein
MHFSTENFHTFSNMRSHRRVRIAIKSAKFKDPDLRLRRRGAQNAANIRQNIRKFSRNAVKFERQI